MLKKENQNLQAILKRYRKQLQEVTGQGKDGGPTQNMLSQLMNPTHNQKVMMSLDATSNNDASNTNRTNKQLKRSVSTSESYNLM